MKKLIFLKSHTSGLTLSGESLSFTLSNGQVHPDFFFLDSAVGLLHNYINEYNVYVQCMLHSLKCMKIDYFYVYLTLYITILHILPEKYPLGRMCMGKSHYQHLTILSICLTTTRPTRATNID